MYICTAVTAVFAGVLAVHIITYLIAVPVPPGRPTNTGLPTSLPRNQLLMGILERNVFGIEKEHPIGTAGQQTQPGSAPLTQEAFSGKLTGIILGTDFEDSVAIIVTGSNDVYALRGAAPIKGYKLKSIAQKSAVVEYGGKEYALKLAESSTATQITQAATPPATRPPTPATRPPATDSGGTNLVTVKRSDLVEQLKDQSALVRDTAIAAYYEDGKNAGYRITRLGQNAPIKILGFERGDIIKRVNGEEISNPVMLFELANKVEDIDAITIDLVRNNEKKTIFVEIQ